MGERCNRTAEVRGSNSPQLHQEVRANRRDFPARTIARHFRDLGWWGADRGSNRTRFGLQARPPSWRMVMTITATPASTIRSVLSEIVRYPAQTHDGQRKSLGEGLKIKVPFRGGSSRPDTALRDFAPVTPRHRPADVVKNEMVLVRFGKRRTVFANARSMIDSFFD